MDPPQRKIVGRGSQIHPANRYERVRLAMTVLPDAAEADAPGVARPSHLLWAIGLGALAIVVALIGGFAVERYPFAFDRAILLWFRDPGDLARAAGPAWLPGAMVDLTALGGATVLTCITVACIGLLLVRRLWLTAALIAAATITGSTLAAQAKLLFGRARPDLVEHLVPVGGLSFPSGHATNSAVIYLTLALLISQVAHGRATRRYIVGTAVLLVGVIGISRVYLGVHWPSDVLAGWSIGTLWALAWWFAGAKLRSTLR